MPQKEARNKTKKTPQIILREAKNKYKHLSKQDNTPQILQRS